MLFLVFLLVIITGIFSYLKLNNIISTVKTGISPDRNVILVKEIYNDLTEAENRVKSYSLSKNEEDMVRFYELTKITGNMLDKLKEAVADDTLLSPYIDTLDILVENKFDILDQLLVLQDEYMVRQAMNEVMENIQEKEPVEIGDTIVYDTLVEPVEAKKENFFSRLFRKKKVEEVAADTIIIADTLRAAAPEPPSLTVEEISQQFAKVQKKAIIEEKHRKEEELKLFQQDRMVMKRISEVLAFLEVKEDLKLKQNTAKAEDRASQVKRVIATFGLAALVLLLLVSYGIYIYIKRNNEYREVLRKARSEAEQLATARQQFLANMSHEIRTPMNIISGYLRQMKQDPLPKEQQDKLEIVRKSSDHLLQLLNNLLDLSRIQADRLELMDTPFSPEEIIQDMHRWFLPQATEKKLKFQAYSDPFLPKTVTGDPVRLRQVLFNLTANAIKFTDKGSVAIRGIAGIEKEGKKEITFEVIDTGIGISKEDQERIFTEFEQVGTSLNKLTEGAGLGLAITHKLVELLGGRLELQSTPSRGSTFRVTIPFVMVEQSTPNQQDPNETGDQVLSGTIVMVVDDEEYNRSLVRLVLERYGAIVFEAESGEESVRLFHENDIDLVLMDMRMPGMTGPEAATSIRELGRKKGRIVPVVAFSAGLVKEDRTKYQDLGIDDFLDKPFEESILVDTILKLTMKEDQKTTKAKRKEGREGHPISSELPPEEVHLDLAGLWESSGGNKQFYLEMVDLFVKNTRAGLDQLDELLAAKRWKEAGEIAHKISAPCKHVRAMVLYRLIKQMESRFMQEKGVREARDLLKKANKEFDFIRKEINSHTEPKPE